VDVYCEISALFVVARVIHSSASLDGKFSIVWRIKIVRFLIGALAKRAGVCFVWTSAEIPKTRLEHGEWFIHSGIPSETGWVRVGIAGQHGEMRDEEDGVIVDPDIVRFIDPHRVAVIGAHSEHGDRLGGGGDSVLREDFADASLCELRAR
jgi:hypothetical protein